MLRAVIVVSWLAVIALTGTPQAASLNAGQQASCVLDGIVKDASTGEGLRKVTVRLTPRSRSEAGYQDTSDVSGRFHFEGVRADDYELTGQHPGYSEGILGAGEPGGSGVILHLVAGIQLAALELKLFRHSSVSGKVLDENGQPLLGVLVQAVRQQWFRGHKAYFTPSQASTNDMGEYRMSGLEPGRYYLYASGPDEGFVEEQGKPEKRMLPVFYPGLQTLEDATPFELHAAEDLAGIDFRLRAAAVFHIRGRVDFSASADKPEDLMVNARKPGMPPELADMEGDIKLDGSFDITGVPPGDYEVGISNRVSHQLGTVHLEVRANDVNGVVIVVLRGSEVKGKIQFAGRDTGDASSMSISLGEPGGDLHHRAYFGTVSRDGAFTIRDVPPGQYVVGVFGEDQTEYVKSVQYAQEEVLGVPIDLSGGVAGDLIISISKGAGQVGGSVRWPGQGEPGSQQELRRGADVVLVSERVRLDGWAVQFASIDQDGQFSFKSVPPGKYYGFAAENVEGGLWENRDFIAKLQDKGVEVIVPENGNVQVQIPVLAAEDVRQAMNSLGL